jgi:hypothetical protein
MFTVIDNLATTTGWTVGGSAVISGVCTWPDFIAGGQAGSLIFQFVVANDYVKKTLTAPVTLSGNNRITLSLWSQNLGLEQYSAYTDFSYKIEFGSGKEYYLPVHEQFTDVTFDVSDLTTIEYIKITNISGTPDYLLASYCVMSLDEFPLDIFNAVKTSISALMVSKYDSSYLAGTVASIAAGDKSITFTTDQSWINRYAKIKITGGGHTEYHHIETVSGRKVTFTSYYDGVSALYAYTNASIYLIAPCEFGKYESEIVIPSITVWGLAPENNNIESDIQTVYDTWKADGSANESMIGKWYKYNLLIDCESESVELLTTMSSVVKSIIGRHVIWVNGKKCRLDMESAPTISEPVEFIANIPKIQYNCSVMVNEEIYDKTRWHKAAAATITANITTVLGRE